MSLNGDLSGIGSLDREQLGDAAATSNAAFAQLSGKVQWQEFVCRRRHTQRLSARA